MKLIMFFLNIHGDLFSFRSNSKGWKDGGITKKCHHLFDPFAGLRQDPLENIYTLKPINVYKQ